MDKKQIDNKQSKCYFFEKRKCTREKCRFRHPKSECERFKQNKCDLGSQCDNKHGEIKRTNSTQTEWNESTRLGGTEREGESVRTNPPTQAAGPSPPREGERYHRNHLRTSSPKGPTRDTPSGWSAKPEQQWDWGWEGWPPESMWEYLCVNTSDRLLIIHPFQTPLSLLFSSTSLALGSLKVQWFTYTHCTVLCTMDTNQHLSCSQIQTLSEDAAGKKISI